MPKRAVELKALAVKNLKEVGFHAVGGVAGLYLQIQGANSKSWIYRIVVGGKRRKIGLGAYPDTTLAQAQQKAIEQQNQAKLGIDPVAKRKADKSRLIVEQSKAVTFKQAARRFIDDTSPKWKNAKHASQWENTLATYAHPFIGDMIVNEIDILHIRKIIDPIWKTKIETASRVRGRIAQILDWAALHKLRSTENPARALAIVYKRNKHDDEEHFPALPHAEIGSFMAALQERQGMSARCLEFAILTAVRSAEVRGAPWSEIDFEKKLWVIPKERMKKDREHTIPLSTQAISLLQRMHRNSNSHLVFPSPMKGVVLSDMSMMNVIRKMGTQVLVDGELKAVTQHGFRSTLRDWAADCTNFDRTTCEHALSHKLPDKVEAAYLRTTLLPKRKKLMQAWADRCYSADNLAD